MHDQQEVEATLHRLRADLPDAVPALTDVASARQAFRRRRQATRTLGAVAVVALVVGAALSFPRGADQELAVGDAPGTTASSVAPSPSGVPDPAASTPENDTTVPVTPPTVPVATPAALPTYAGPIDAPEAVLSGRLVGTDGCLFLDDPSGERFLLLWPSGSTVTADLAYVQLSGTGQIGPVGADIRFGGGEVPQDVTGQLGVLGIDPACVTDRFALVVRPIDQ